MRGHSCPRINTIALSYSGHSGITVRMANCNDTVVGDLVSDPIEKIMEKREEIRMTFIRKHLISNGCVEHCHAVSQMRRDGFIRDREFQKLREEEVEKYYKSLE